MNRRILPIGGALLLAAACADTPTEPATEVVGDLLTVQSMVDICHYDADLGEYFPISVSDNGYAVEAHMAHGDGYPGEPVPGDGGYVFDEACIRTVVEEPEQPLVIAYTDVDGQEGFNPDGGDRLIVKVVDMDNTGDVSEGDRVLTAEYPKNLDGPPFTFGEFTVTEHVVSFVREQRRGYAQFEASDGNKLFTFFGSEPEANWGFEWYEEYDFATRGGTRIIDDETGFNGDLIDIRSSSPSQPPESFRLGDYPAGSADNQFLEVRVPLGGP